LTPTYKIPDKKQLSEKEMQVYSTVFRRFIAVFCAEDCLVSRTEISIAVGDLETFTLKGTVMLERGWTKYDDYNQKDKVLPKLLVGDRVNINFRPVEKETTPPKHYTIETLNNYLKNPFKDDKKVIKETVEVDEHGEGDDAEDYKAIFEGLELGTEATRTGIIDNARKSGYIDLKKDTYTILPGGEFLIESLLQMQISMDKYKTSQLGQALKKVYRGTMTVDESVQLAQKEIAEVFDKKSDTDLRLDSDIGFFGDVVGICPICGKEIKRFRTFYGCTGYKDGCKFSVNTRICQRTISMENVRMLIESGRTAVIQGFVSPRTGKTFDAALKIENGRAVFDFEKREQSAKPVVLPESNEEEPPLPEPPPGY
jgi:DNA topoisomerase-3